MHLNVIILSESVFSIFWKESTPRPGYLLVHIWYKEAELYISNSFPVPYWFYLLKLGYISYNVTLLFEVRMVYGKPFLGLACYALWGYAGHTCAGSPGWQHAENHHHIGNISIKHIMHYLTGNCFMHACFRVTQ